MTTKFKVKFLPQYLHEIFGNPEFQNPLLTQNLSQKTKFALKKLGNSLQEEYKQVLDQLRELYKGYSEEVPDESTEVTSSEEETVKQAPKKEPATRVKEEFKEQFLKESLEIENMDVEIDHPELTERDFFDRSTGEVIGSTNYYNVIDILLYERDEKKD